MVLLSLHICSERLQGDESGFEFEAGPGLLFLERDVLLVLFDRVFLPAGDLKGAGQSESHLDVLRRQRCRGLFRQSDAKFGRAVCEQPAS